MLGNSRRSKIKNEEIMLWRKKLSQYCYDIVYLQGKFNVASDSLPRVYCAGTIVNALYRIYSVYVTREYLECIIISDKEICHIRLTT